MKRILGLVVLLFLIPVFALAQTKIQELGLKGPVKEVTRSYRIFRETHTFSEVDKFCTSYSTYRDGILQDKKNFDNKERVVEEYARNALNALYLYDDYKLTFVTQYPNHPNTKRYGKLDKNGTIIQRTTIYENINKIETEEFLYNQNNKRIKTIRTTNDPLRLVNINGHELEFLPMVVFETLYNEFGQTIRFSVYWVTTSNKYVNRLEWQSTYKDGLIIESTLLHDEKIVEVEKYQYLEFDKYNNWTKQSQVTTTGDSEPTELIISREIKYY